MLGPLERLAARILPSTIVRSLQRFKQTLPLRLSQTTPVVQMFINDGTTRSYVGLHNFFSYLMPELVSDVTAELTFYDPQGRRVLRHRERLPHFGARAVDVAALLAARGADVPHGVVTLQLTPGHPRRASYRTLGQFAAHFFVFFRDAAGSVEQTHPLATAGPANAPAGLFLSSQVISTAGLDEVVLFQYNPGDRPCTFEHRLLDARDRRVVAKLTRRLPPLGSCRTTFRLAELEAAPPQLLLVVDPLPSANGKPMLRRVFKSGLHSMSHS